MIRVFVGNSANGEDAESCVVLEHSLRKHASEPVEIVWMRASRDPASPWGGWDMSRWATPFSGFRWAIPEVCGFEGRAIYTDSDVIFTADVAELWRQDMAGRVVLAKPGSWRMCVSLWDCAAARRHAMPLDAMKANEHAHSEMGRRYRDPALVGAFDGNWNCLDGEAYADLADPEIKALHYTDMGTQPQLRHALPRLERAGLRHWFDGKLRQHPRADLVALFDRLLEEALASGYSVADYIPNELFGEYRKASLVNYKARAR